MAALDLTALATLALTALDVLATLALATLALTALDTLALATLALALSPLAALATLALTPRGTLLFLAQHVVLAHLPFRQHVREACVRLLSPPVHLLLQLLTAVGVA